MTQNNFPRTLALLRKEKGLSQRQVAQDLGISQALLSHYEKGIRESGLMFVVKCAAYFDVSADFLLGISPERKGAVLVLEDLPPTDARTLGNAGAKSMMPTLNKRLIHNSLNVLYDYLTQIGNQELTRQVSDYLMLSVYSSIRTVHAASKGNQDVMFQIPKEFAGTYSAAVMQMIEARTRAMLSEHPVDGVKRIREKEAFLMSTEQIAADYPQYASSLFNLIKRAEETIFEHSGKRKQTK